MTGGDVIEKLYLPRIRLGVKHLFDKEDRVILVELDEFNKWVIRHQIIGIFFRGALLRGGG